MTILWFANIINNSIYIYMCVCVCVLRINNSTLSLGKFISFKTKYKINLLDSH